VKRFTKVSDKTNISKNVYINFISFNPKNSAEAAAIEKTNRTK
jgi:hypothetical protein